MTNDELKRARRSHRRAALWEGFWFVWVMACWYGYDNWGGWWGVGLATLGIAAVYEVIVRNTD